MNRQKLRMWVVMGSALLTGVPHAAEFQVNTTVDGTNINLTDGLCRTALGQCTLRAVVEQANHTPGKDTIRLPLSTYLLSVGASGEDQAHAGDLDITDELDIIGAAKATTIINGGAIDRVFQIMANVKATISGVTIKNGVAKTESGGGCILNYEDIVLRDAEVVDCATGVNTRSNTGGGLWLFDSEFAYVENAVIDENSGQGVYSDISYNGIQNIIV